MNSDINLLTFILVDKKYVNMLGNLWILQKGISITSDFPVFVANLLFIVEFVWLS